MPNHDDNLESRPQAEHHSKPVDESAPLPQRVVSERRSVRSWALTGLLVLAVFYTAYFARSLILPLVVAFLLSFLLAPVVRFLERFRLPTPIAAGIVIIFMGGVLAGSFYELSTPAAEWLKKAPTNLRQLDSALRHVRKPVEQVGEAAKEVEQMADMNSADNKVPKVQVKEPGLAASVLSGTKSVLVSAAVITVLLYFMLASGDLFLRKLIHVLPTMEDKKAAVAAAHQVKTDISLYLFTVVLINLGLGAVVAGAMYLLDMPNPLLWGVVATALNFVPYMGAIVGAFVFASVALTTFGEWINVVEVVGVYLSLTAVEGYFITPTLLGKALTLNPVVIFIGLILWTWVWGIPGALLSVPLLVITKILCDHIDALSPLGEFLGR